MEIKIKGKFVPLLLFFHVVPVQLPSAGFGYFDKDKVFKQKGRDKMEFALGITLIFMSIVHVIYGERKQVDVLKKLTSNSILIGSFRVMSLQGGILLFAIGIVYILSYIGTISLTGIAAYFPVSIILLNILSLLVISLTKHRDLLKIMVPQLIIFAILIALQILVIR
jgi:hypothetical protein